MFFHLSAKFFQPKTQKQHPQRRPAIDASAFDNAKVLIQAEFPLQAPPINQLAKSLQYARGFGFVSFQLNHFAF